MFSVLAVVTCLGPIAGNPLFRQLYNVTLNNFPGSIYILFAALQFAALSGNFLVFIKRTNVNEDPSGVTGHQNNDDVTVSQKNIHQEETVSTRL